MKSLLSISDLSVEEMLELFNLADKFRKGFGRDFLSGKCMLSMFLQPSTRTRLSFTRAMQILGGVVLDFGNAEISSLARGETLSDTIKTIREYDLDCIVFRHSVEYSASRVAELAYPIPVINAGDGTNEHPTQALLDLYTLKKTFGRIDGLSIAIIGDLRNHRVAHSLLLALSKFDVTLYLVSPLKLAMPGKYLKQAQRCNIVQILDGGIKEVFNKVDAIYITPFIPYFENFYNKLRVFEKISKEDYYLSRESFESGGPLILHPLPRHVEIKEDVDDLPQAKYFEQVKNGLYIRIAILYSIIKS